MTLPEAGATLGILLPLARLLAALWLAVPLAACAPGPDTSGIAVSVPYAIDTLDPHARNILGNFALVSNFYDSLVSTDADLKIRPSLARLWENPDRTTWIFHLRPGVRFADGSPLTAEDVIATLERLRTTPGLEMTTFVPHISEATALDTLTVRIRTPQPLSILLNKLCFVAITRKGAAALDRTPNGTGPYVLAEWTPGLLRLQRRDDYWGAKPAFHDVTYRLGRSPIEAADDVLSGRSQLAQCNSRKAEARVRDARRFDLLRQPSVFLKYLSFDLVREQTPFASVKRNPFLNKLVRQAINLSIDRNRLVASLSADAAPANQLVPPAIFGFNPAIPPPLHDPQEARALLKKAGLPGGFHATLLSRRLFADAAHAVREQLKDIGITLDIEIQEDPAFFDTIDRHEFSFFLSRFGCPTGDASDILEGGLHSRDAARNMGRANDSGYSSAQVDRLIEESAGIEGLKDRREVLQGVTALVMEDLPWIPLYVDLDVYAKDPSLVWRPRNDSYILAAEVGRR